MVGPRLLVDWLESLLDWLLRRISVFCLVSVYPSGSAARSLLEMACNNDSHLTV